MKRSFYLLLPAVFALNIQNVSALEIDEKLTLRFLKVSSTQKTVLINRGGEDGLVVGDHAKFFITAGVVARGVAEKVSPSRSVWSLYRVVDPNEITQDKALNLKIASPVKITDDPSKSLKEEAIPGGAETMNVEETNVAADEKEIVVSDEDKDELKGLGVGEEEEVRPPVKTSGKKSKPTSVMEDVPVDYGTNTTKNWEVWGMMYLNSLSGTVESDAAAAGESTTSTASTVDFSGGVEKYFLTSDNFLKEVSLSGFLHKKTVENGDSITSTADWLEYGVGVNYHFYHSAASVNRLIGYGAFTLGKGSATVETTSPSSTLTGEGTNSFMSAGAGAKYVLSNGFGVRAVLDYYSSSESYEYESGTTEEKTLSGMRVQFGLSYRF